LPVADDGGGNSIRPSTIGAGGAVAVAPTLTSALIPGMITPVPETLASSRFLGTMSVFRAKANSLRPQT
jgi:hypothetical protein